MNLDDIIYKDNNQIIMIVDENYRIEVTITKNPVSSYKNLEWDTMWLTPYTLLNRYIRKGYNWTNLYRDLTESFTQESFMGSHCVVINVNNDKNKKEMMKLFKKPNFLKPTFGYSHPEKDSNKLVYCFLERITPSIFQTVYDNVWRKIGFTQDSNHRAGSAMVQKNKGNDMSNIRCSLTNIIYSIDDFLWEM